MNDAHSQNAACVHDWRLVSASSSIDGSPLHECSKCGERTAAFAREHEKNLHILRLIRDEPAWALSRIRLAERLEEAVEHVVADSPGTPDSVKGYLRDAKRGWKEKVRDVA